MRQHYDKLIRDRIPEIIRAEGKNLAVEVMDQAAYRTALRAKVVEEAGEIAQAVPEALPGEIADLYEVLSALCAAHDIPEQHIHTLRRTKQRMRGGFDRRLRLLWVE